MSLEREVTGREEGEAEGGGGTELIGSTVTGGSYSGRVGGREWGGCVEDSGKGRGRERGR